MKVYDILETKNHSWNNDSCDIWIAPSGRIYDLGTDSSHLQYVKENVGDKKDSSDLVDAGWIKLTNTKNKVEITAQYSAIHEHKRLFVPVILEKAKIQEFELKISYTDSGKVIELNMPADELKFIGLI